MSTQFSLLLAATICLPLASLAGQAQSTQIQSFPVKKCDDPKVPIGILPRGIGRVSYLVGKDGKPDTTSIAVLKVIGLSPAAFRSVAARTLSVCHLDVSPTPGTSLSVTSEITFADSSVVQVGVTPLSSDAATPLAIEAAHIPKDSFPLAIDDRRVEEHPRRLACKGAPPPPPIRVTGRGANVAQAQRDAQDQVRTTVQQYNAAYGGVLVAVVRVDVDGKPGTQVKVISITNPMAAQSLAEQIGGCRFAPGRVAGVIVPAYIQVTVP
jgi:hypothetical protein